MLNLYKLKYVITVAEEKSITKAAKKLYISQPSLSLSIHAIEDSLGVELFVRGKNSVTLTPAGQIFVEWAKTTVESAKQLEAKLGKIKAGSKRQLDIGASYQRSAALLPESISRFYNRTDNCSIKIHEDINANLNSALQADQLDITVGLPQADTTLYKTVPLFQERFLLAASKQVNILCTPAEPYAHVDKSAIVGQPVIMLQEQQYLGKVMRNLLLDLNYIPEMSTVCTNMETVHSLVSKNAGISLLPEVSVLLRRIENVNYYMFSDPTLSRTVAAVYKKNNPKLDDIELFVRCLKDYIRDCPYPFEILN
jgi:DNA-binding transcriptional LysR family regulator